jgi:hypothetical protein
VLGLSSSSGEDRKEARAGGQAVERAGTWTHGSLIHKYGKLGFHPRSGKEVV